MNMTNEQQQIILKAIQEANDKQTEQLKKYINKELQEIKDEIYKERQRITNLEEKYTQISQKYQVLEKSLRKNNIIVFGLEYKKGNLLDYTINKLNSNLQLNLTPGDINNIYTIGKKENKPIIIKFTTHLQKQNVLRNCSKLKNTNIKISEELSVEEREEVRELQKHLKKARSKNLKSYIVGTKLYVNGKKYTTTQLPDIDELEEIEVPIEEIESGDEVVEAQEENQTTNFGEQQRRKKKVATTITPSVTTCTSSKVFTAANPGRSSSRLATIIEKGKSRNNSHNSE